MASLTFDDPDLQSAMRSFLAACDAVAGAVDDAAVLQLSDARAMAGLSLRKRLVELGWSAPSTQRASHPAGG